MDGSILEDVRITCNLNREDDSFDDQLILHTNTYLFRAEQIGVGKKGFAIDGVDQCWSDFVEENFDDYHALKTFVGLSVLLIFDPPENATVLSSIQQTIDKMEWCLYAEADLNKN